MTEPSSVELHRLKKEIELLEDKKGRGTELVSLLIPPDKNLNDVMSQMRSEYSQASNIKSTRTRKNVLSALEMIMQRLKLITQVPPNGLAMYIGSIPHGIKDKMEVHIIEPPKKLTTYTYRCDSTFLLEPIKDMLVDKGVYGLLTVDRAEATIALLKGHVTEIVQHIDSRVPRKHGRGGQSQRRFERLIEIAAHEYFKKVGEIASEVFLNQEDLRGVIIGGPGPTKEYFVNEEYLHHEIQKKIVATIDTSYTDEFGIHELVENASDILQDIAIVREKDLVQKFLREVVKDNGLAGYGDKEVRNLLQMGAVDTVLVSENLESFRVKAICANCGYEETKTVRDVKTYEKELETAPCPECQEPALGLEEYQSTLDEITEMAEATGAKVEIISAETEEGQQLKAFGGIAAILRYRP
jgi:peptide chain release factor subunit 1